MTAGLTLRAVVLGGRLGFQRDLEEVFGNSNTASNIVFKIVLLSGVATVGGILLLVGVIESSHEVTAIGAYILGTSVTAGSMGNIWEDVSLLRSRCGSEAIFKGLQVGARGCVLFE